MEVSRKTVVTTTKMTKAAANESSVKNDDDSDTSKQCDLTSKRTRSGRNISSNNGSEYTIKNAKKRERQELMRKLRQIRGKSETERTSDDVKMLDACKDLVEHIDLLERHKCTERAHQEIVLDEAGELRAKCKQLAEAMLAAKHCVIYTGAGISTSASIPDYRGPSGLWTMLKQNIKVNLPDFSAVDPTYSHMALSALMRADRVKHIVSQNCDGLHLRSSIDPEKLSELHGNCFVEFCTECCKDFLREFDVTEHTAFRRHTTGRYCDTCIVADSGKKDDAAKCVESRIQLRDSIVHFGEKLRNGSPYNWHTARDTLKQTDLIVCLGTSLKVLKHYACLWPKKQSVRLFIVNIQWTPKDKQATLKINGYCDQVLSMVVEHMNSLMAANQKIEVRDYSLASDPVLRDAIKLNENELTTTSKRFLSDRMNQRNGTSDNASDQAVSSSGNSWYTRSFKSK